jgi:hypothetical protein
MYKAPTHPYFQSLTTNRPAANIKLRRKYHEYSMSEAKIGVVTLSHKLVRLPMIMFMHTVGLVNSASRSAMIENIIFLYFDGIPCPFWTKSSELKQDYI